MKAAACDREAQRRVVGHHPCDARQDDRAEHGGGDQRIFQSHGIIEPVPDRPQLQTDQHKRQHVENKNHGFPHRVGGHAQPRGGSRWRGARNGDRVGDDRQNTGEADMLGNDPDRERAGKLHDDRAWRVRDPPGHQHRNPGE